MPSALGRFHRIPLPLSRSWRYASMACRFVGLLGIWAFTGRWSGDTFAWPRRDQNRPGASPSGPIPAKTRPSGRERLSWARRGAILLHHLGLHLPSRMRILWADLFHRGKDFGDIGPSIRPPVRQGDLAFRYRDPTLGADMEEAAKLFVARLREAKGDSTRYTGVNRPFAARCLLETKEPPQERRPIPQARSDMAQAPAAMPPPAGTCGEARPGRNARKKPGSVRSPFPHLPPCPHGRNPRANA